MLAAIGGRDLQKAQTNHMGDFNAIIDFPPAPKLDVDEPPRSRRRRRRRSCAAKRCSTARRSAPRCHPAASHFTDNTMHDLKVERFYAGRPEGPIKTFPLRGIKDSPPYLHDGRLLTLRGRGGVLRHRPRHAADRRGEAGPGRVPALPVMPF